MPSTVKDAQRRESTADLVTGARVDYEIEVGLSPERMWDLVTDVSRIGEWSPECVYGAWLDPEPEPGLPRAGSRFAARNQYTPTISIEVPCVVTEAERPGVFAWGMRAIHAAGLRRRSRSGGGRIGAVGRRTGIGG